MENVGKERRYWKLSRCSQSGAEKMMKRGDGHVKKVGVNKITSVEPQNQARLVKTGNTGN
jgi:hypothetical protein